MPGREEKGMTECSLTAGQEDPSLFCCYEEVASDVEKAQKVWNTVHRRMGEESQEMIARAASCPNPEKADAIFRMIVLGLYLPDGRETPRYLSRPEIMKMMELGRKAGNIAMRYMEILRFEELENGSSPWKSRSGSGCTDTDGSSLCRPVSDGELDDL